MRMKKRSAIGALLTVGLVACMTAPSIPKKSPAPISGTASVLGEAKVPGSKILKLDYDGFTVWLDCDKRGPVKLDTTLNTTAAMRRVHRLSG
jgi:endonuclease G